VAVQRSGSGLGAVKRGAVIAAALATASCGSIQNMMPDPADFKLPDRTTFLPNNIVSYSRPVSLGPVGPRELVDAQGLCPGAAGQSDESLPTRGIGLDMTECDVVRALGPPQSTEITPRPGDQRVAVLTYSSGDRAGIYRFNGGRLVSIERGSEPPPPPPPVQKKPPAKKPRPPSGQ
jgi:hypothetical protein